MWRHIVKTHVRTLIVIKLNRLCHGSFYFFYGMKLDIFKEFVLYCAVQSLCHSIILWISTLGHTYMYARFIEQ